jgi:glycosyltransferase involved in cell wall biosynthesis
MSKSILIITPRIPYPLKDGGALAMHQCIDMYKQQGYDVHLLSINTHKHWLSESDYPPLFNQLSSFETVAINTDVKVRSAFINLFSKKSYNVERFVKKEFEDALQNKLVNTEFDFIQFESIFTAPYLETAKKYSAAKMICRVHNIEHKVWEQIAKQENGLFKKRYLKLLTERLKTFELNILNQFDLLLNISKLEGQSLKDLNIATAQYHLAFGIEKIRFQRQKIAQEEHSVYHLGSMDWIPNQEGVTWFVKRIWPEVLKKHSELKLYLAGRNMPNAFYRYQSKSIEVVGEVDEMSAFSLSKNLMIIPLLSGSGLRIKVLEAMMLGKTIISTPKGIEGFDLIDKKHVLLATTPEEFVDKIDWCLQNKEEAIHIGETSQQFALDHFDKRKIYSALDKFLSDF